MVFSIVVDVDDFCAKLTTTLTFWSPRMHGARILERTIHDDVNETKHSEASGARNGRRWRKLRSPPFEELEL